MRNILYLRKEIFSLTFLTTMSILCRYLFLSMNIFFDFNSFCIILLLTFGVFHGVNDLSLKLSTDSNKVLFKEPFKRNRLFQYLFFIILLLSIFYCFPFLGIVIFLLFSAYHFGEQHFYIDTKGFYVNTILFRFFLGLTILGALFFLHSSEVVTILSNYLDLQLSSHIVWFQIFFFGPLVLQSLYLIRLVFLYRIRFMDWVLFQMSILSLILLFAFTDLLTSFTFYFVVWHSIPSLRLQIRNDYQVLNSVAIKDFILRGFPFYLMSLSIFFPLFFEQARSQQILRFYISLGAAIVIPHIITVYKMVSVKFPKPVYSLSVKQSVK